MLSKEYFYVLYHLLSPQNGKAGISNFILQMKESGSGS